MINKTKGIHWQVLLMEINKMSREVLDGLMEYKTTLRKNLIKMTDEMSLDSLTGEEGERKTQATSLKK